MKSCQLKPLLLAASLGVSGGAHACFPNTGPVTTFTGAATVQIEALKASFTTIMVEPTKLQVVAAINNLKNTTSDQASQLSQAIIEAQIQETNKMIETKRTASELKMTHQMELDHIAAINEDMLIPMDGIEGGQSEAYFAKLCANDKMQKLMLGKAQKSINADTAKNVEQQLKEATTPVPASLAARRVQLAHYNNYCSEDLVEAGACEVAAKIPNADLLADVAIKPSNDPESAVIKDVAFKTEYTYSSFEQEAAADFFANIIQLNKLPTPPLTGEAADPDVIARYNQLKAAQSLANLSFLTTQSVRKPITGDGSSQMSKLDLLRYKLHKAQTEDYSTALTAKENGKMVYVLSQMSFGNQLRMEIRAYKERIANLKAASFTVDMSSPTKIQTINSLR